MKHVAVFLAGVGLSLVIALGLRRSRAPQAVHGIRRPGVDLNECSIDQLTLLGLDGEVAGRIIENRPYRNKLELVSRVMLPNEVYASIRRRVYVSGRGEPVKIAS